MACGASEIIAGQGMLEIWGGLQRLQRFVREPFGQHLREAATEFFARDLARAPFKFSPVALPNRSTPSASRCSE
jgi:hypothetical protein